MSNREESQFSSLSQMLLLEPSSGQGIMIGTIGVKCLYIWTIQLRKK